MAKISEFKFCEDTESYINRNHFRKVPKIIYTANVIKIPVIKYIQKSVIKYVDVIKEREIYKEVYVEKYKDITCELIPFLNQIASIDPESMSESANPIFARAEMFTKMQEIIKKALRHSTNQIQ